MSEVPYIIIGALLGALIVLFWPRRQSWLLDMGIPFWLIFWNEGIRKRCGMCHRHRRTDSKPYPNLCARCTEKWSK